MFNFSLFTPKTARFKEGKIVSFVILAPVHRYRGTEYFSKDIFQLNEDLHIAI